MSHTAHAETLTARRSARLVSWARAWRAGLVSFDEMLDAIIDDEEQLIDGIPGTVHETEMREALPAMAKLHPDEIRLVLPAPGDPRGLPGPGVPFTERALLSGEGPGTRREIIYFDDNGSLNAVRVDDWKIAFKIQEGNLQDAVLRPVNMPYVINLRQDPYERFMRDSKMYFRWYADKLWIFVPAQTVVGMFLESFKEFPTSQKSGTFGVDEALAQLSAPGGTGR